MSQPDEGQVLQWFERALDQPRDTRRDWLSAQQLPEWLHLRVIRLLETEASMDAFLETPPAPPEPDDFPQLGERLGSYELVSRIDSGGMGVVYLARRADHAYQQQVAVKLIRPLHLGAGAAFRAQLVSRFENERALLARLSHPNIARILDGGSTASGLPWLAMEYVQGLSLIDYCEHHALDVRARIQLFRKVCDGVQEAHRHLIVHRDLKPENILVGTDGEPRLLDFGIARTLESEESIDPSLTSLTAMTPAYASPEQVRREPVTTRSDVYSLGVVLYQLLTGVRPYELAGLSPAQVERTVCDTRPRPLREAARASGRASGRGDATRSAAAGFDHDLERIVERAMHKDAQRRYGSAQELSQDLRRHLEGRPVEAHPDSSWYRAGKFLRRHRIGSALAVMALAAVLGAAGMAGWQARKAARAADDMRQVNAFLLDVLSMTDPFNDGGELTLSQAVDAAAERIDSHFPDRPDLSSEVRFGIGYGMIGQFRLPQAEAQLERALHDSDRAFGRGDVRTIRIIEGMAGLRQEQGRMAEAEALYREGIALSAQGAVQREPVRMYLLNNLGMMYLTQERYAEADTQLQLALATWLDQRGDLADEDDHAILLSNLAQAAHGLGDLPRADTLYQQAQNQLEAQFPDGNADLAIALSNRAQLAEEQGDPRAALALYQRSLAMREKVFRGDHPGTVTGLTNVARMLAADGDHGAGLALAERAATMADRVYDVPSPRHAATYGTLAALRLAGGDVAGATTAITRAGHLLAKVDAPPPSTREQLNKVRLALCAQQASATAGGPDSPAAACPGAP